MSQSRIRNFCIVAHIDHGKSTLADRLIEATGAVEKRQMREQLLDTMDLERERGITIKLNAVRMAYTARDGTDYELNLIDTPGHVDFTYEVSRSLAACEGAILVVDASQGIQAQTLSNLFLAMDAGLEIIPVLNKIDLPGAEPERRAQEIMDLIGAKREEILAVSAKEGIGIPELLEAIVARVPPPQGREDAPLRALIFDSYYDRYRGRHSEHPGGGRRGARRGWRSRSAPTRTTCTTWTKWATSSWASGRRRSSRPGEVGYLVASLRDVRDARVGDTIFDAHDRAPSCCRGTARSSRWCSRGSIPPSPTSTRACATRWRSSGSTTPASSTSRRRPPRSASASAAASSACCTWRSCRSGWSASSTSTSSRTVPDGGVSRVRHRRRDAAAGESQPPARPRLDRPDRGALREGAHHGARPTTSAAIMKLGQERRGVYHGMHYIDTTRVEFHFEFPLGEIVLDFYDKLKSLSRGYASLDYEMAGYRESDLVKLDMLINGDPIDAFSVIIHRDKAYEYGRKVAEKLKELIPRQLFRWRSRRRSATRSSPARRSPPSARTCSPSATAATSPASASSSRSRRRGRSA